MDSKTQEFLQKLKDSGNWNDDYDFSEAIYLNNSSPLIIIDKTLDTKHIQTPAKILSRGIFCGFTNAIDKKDFTIRKLKKEGLYRKEYDFKEFNISSTREKGVVIYTPYLTKHELNYQSLIKGSKCGIKNALNKNDFIIKEFQKKHGEKYTYQKVNYKNDYEHITVTC